MDYFIKNYDSGSLGLSVILLAGIENNDLSENSNDNCDCDAHFIKDFIAKSGTLIFFHKELIKQGFFIGERLIAL